MHFCHHAALLIWSILGYQRVSAFQLHGRDNIVGTGNNLSDSHDIRYSTKITLNGKDFEVLIDTGSTDTYVVGTVPDAYDTSRTATLSFVGGDVPGTIKLATMNVFNGAIDAQAFVEVSPNDTTEAEGTGLIGLGPRFGSTILGSVPSPYGLPPLDRLFRQNMSLPNILTVNLNRGSDPSNPFPGDITVGTVLPGLDDIDNSTKLPIMETSRNVNQHWQVLLDEAGIIGPDGNIINVTSTVGSNDNKNRAVVIFDTGFTLPQVPQRVADAFYANITGAKLENLAMGGLGKIYTLPCTAEVNVSWVFAGQVIPIHPLDMIIDPTELNVPIPDGTEPFCIGAFQPSSEASMGDTYDMILGMAWLRNVYILVNFGDFVDGTNVTADPFIQLLATTNNTAEAHQDFVTVRLGGNDNTVQQWPLGQLPPNFPPPSLLTTTSASTGPSQTAAIVGASVGGFVGLLVVWAIGLTCWRRSRVKKGLRAPSGTGGMFDQAAGQYKPLLNPTDSHMAERRTEVRRLYAPVENH